MTHEKSHAGDTRSMGVRLPVDVIARRQAEAKAARISTNRLLERIIDEGNVQIFARPELNPVKQELTRYYRAASNNLNQLARRAHIDYQAGNLSAATYDELLAYLITIERYLAAKVQS